MYYTIVTAEDTDALVERVQKRMAQGWSPLGGPFVFPWSSGHGLTFRPPAFREREAMIYEEQAVHATLGQAMVADR